MTIQVSWTNPNDVVMDSIEIYRTATRGGVKALIATLDKDTLGYLDENVTSNATYFYTVRFIKGEQFSDSIEFPLGFYPDTGPGPTTLTRGDWEFGFFGEIPASQLFLYSDITAKVQADINQIGTMDTWLKWVVNGRIIFIPNNYYSYNSLFGSGSSGIGTAVLPAGADPATSANIVNKGDYQFLIRSPYATNKFTTAVNAGGLFAVDENNVITQYDTDMTKTEMGAILASIVRNMALIAELNGQKFSDYDVTSVSQGIISNTYITDTLLFKTEDLVSPGTTVIATNGVTTRFIWWPILELQF